MAYGIGQRLGEGLNPALMQVDFSGIERAGATQGGMFAQLGADIGSGIKTYNDTEKEIKKAEQVAKSIREAIPDLAPMANEALANLNNPDLSQRDRHAIAQAIGESLKIGVLGIENKRADALMGMDREKFDWQRDMAERELAMSMNMAMNTPTKKKQGMVPTAAGDIMVNFDEYGQMYDLDGNPTSTEKLQKQYGGGDIAPPDGVMPQGTPMGGDAQGRIALPMRQQGDDLVAAEIAALADATPQVGDFPDYGSIQEAMSLDEQGNGMVLPPRQQPMAQGGAAAPRIGFKPAETKEAEQPREITLSDGSIGYGTFKDNVFKPALGPDGQPLVVPKQVDPKIQMEMAKTEEEKMEKARSGLDQSAQFLKSLENLEKHKGFKNLFGTNIGVPTFVPGSAGADAKAELDKVTSKAFMESIQSLKGMGALSNAEGEKASSAFIALNPKMSEEAARKSIREAKEIIMMGMARAQKKLEGQSANSEVTPDDAAATRLQMLLQGK